MYRYYILQRISNKRGCPWNEVSDCGSLFGLIHSEKDLQFECSTLNFISILKNAAKKWGGSNLIRLFVVSCCVWAGSCFSSKVFDYKICIVNSRTCRMHHHPPYLIFFWSQKLYCFVGSFSEACWRFCWVVCGFHYDAALVPGVCNDINGVSGFILLKTIDFRGSIVLWAFRIGSQTRTPTSNCSYQRKAPPFHRICKLHLFCDGFPLVGSAMSSKDMR